MLRIDVLVGRLLRAIDHLRWEGRDEAANAVCLRWCYWSRRRGRESV